MSDSAAKTAPETKKPKQGRSPAYPAISLEKALGKAKDQYEKEGKYPAPMSSAFTAWGFGAKSSGGRDTRAALKYFGLATVEGDGETGKVKLTEDALRVILDEREDQTEKKTIIRRLALNPAIHKKLLEQYPDGIKSDATVEHFLVFEQGYNKSAAGEVVAEFKETAAFAELYKPATIADKEPEHEDDPLDGAKDVKPPEGGFRNPPLPPGNKVQTMAGERELTTGLLSKSAKFRLIVSGDVGVKEIERLIAKLEMDKEILAETDEGGEE